jgi:RHS repeat-associated protein
LELSTEFSGGRLVSGPSGDSVLLYVQDHLGSVRVVLADGRPAAYNEYAPFGESETAYSTDVFQGQRLAPQYNRFRYNGKEEFPQPGSDLLDYGARLYDSVLCRWNAIDPLAEKYCFLSGYAYCGNNPVRFIDPYGLTIAEGSLQEFGRLRQTIRDKLNSWIALKQQYINAFYAQGNSGEPNTSYFDMMIQSVQRSLALMDIIEMSTRIYELNFSEGNTGTLKHTPNTRHFTLTYGNDALFVHELTHAGQLENGDIGFTMGAEKAILIDVFDEVAAYAAQFAFSPISVENLNPDMPIFMMNDITVEWLLTLTDFSTGNYLYNPEFNTSVSMVPVDVNMTWNELLRAYPYVNLGQYGDWGNTAIKDVLHEELVW